MRTLKRYFSYTIVKFVFSGSTAASLYLFALYVLAQVVGLWYISASIIAFLLAFSVSFILQKFLTFEDARVAWRPLGKQLVSHFLLGICSLIANTAFLYLLVEVFGLWYLSGATIAAGSVAVFNFFIYRFFIFEDSRGFRRESGLRTILIATGAYPPDIGGPATYSHTLVRELPKRGCLPYVVSFGAVRSFPRVVRHGVYFFFVLIKGGATDLIFAQDPMSVGLPALLAARLLGKRFAVKIVGDYAWEQYSQRLNVKGQMFVSLDDFQKKKFDFTTEMRRKIEHFVARRADTIIVPSNYLKRIVSMWGVPEEKIKVIYNSFDAPSVTTSKEDVRKKLHIEGTALLSAGRLVPWKGFSVLIEVVAELAKELPDLKLYIAGDGPGEEELKAISHKSRREVGTPTNTSGLQAPVVFLGRLSREELLEYVQASDLFVLNTGYEGFSHQLLEVMALGVPLVTTDSGGNPELVENQKSGILVSYNDKEALKQAIRLLIRDKALREKIAIGGREKAVLFSKKMMIDSLVKTLTSYDEKH